MSDTQQTEAATPAEASESKPAPTPKTKVKAKAKTKAKVKTKTKPKAKNTDEGLFDRAFEFVIAVEGGYVNDDRDPGGETKFGISQKSYPKLVIADLTESDAKDIYRKDFWTVVRGGDLPAGLAVTLFDSAVNCGPRLAVSFLQRSLKVTDDGIIGPITMKAIQAADQSNLVLDILAWRMRHYSNIPTRLSFINGWTRRVLQLLRFVDGL